MWLRGYDMYLCSFVLLALFASSNGRAVNISNTWVLPEEGFPVFYRYFRDRISWYEADAVCQFHHANLVTVDTTAQYDAVRAYLKELDISSSVWVGLIRSNQDGDFTWTDYRGLSGEGYWSSAPDNRVAPLCAAADPAADYRWQSRPCGGPSVASFICELPVPQWANGNEGCMVRELPALTILYLPESAAVQLTADCGLAGVKRVQCTGNMKREDLLKDLSCAEDEEPTVVPSSTSTSIASSTLTSDFTSSEPDPSDFTTDYKATVNNKGFTKTDYSKSTTFITGYGPFIMDNTSNTQNYNLKDLKNIYPRKDINLDVSNQNNLQGDEITNIANSEPYIADTHRTQPLNEKYMQHKMLHNEINKHNKNEMVFSQPSDHFIPPLVMAKAKVSDDMNVLSIEEKHAQQIAEQYYIHHSDLKDPPNSSNDLPNVVTTDNYMNSKDIVTDDNKKLNTKSILPKKYKNQVNDIVFNLGDKFAKFINDSDNIQTTSSYKTIGTSQRPAINYTELLYAEDPNIDLTVIIREPGNDTEEKIFYSNYSDIITKPETRNTDSVLSTDKENIFSTKSPLKQTMHLSIPPKGIDEISKNETNATIVHNVIKLHVIKSSTDENNTLPIVYEILSTKSPVLVTRSAINQSSSVLLNKHFNKETENLAESLTFNYTSTPVYVTTASNLTYYNLSTSYSTSTSAIENITESKEQSTILSNYEGIVTTQLTPVYDVEKIELNNVSTITLHSNQSIDNDDKNISYTEKQFLAFAEDGNENVKLDENPEKNITFSVDVIDDYKSPLLSDASEPVPRPTRLRRLQQPTRKLKFNPFRILG